MKIKNVVMFILSVFLTIVLFSCSNSKQSEESPYSIVEPTKEEILEIESRFGFLFGQFYRDSYDCLKDDIYEQLFVVNLVNSDIYPKYNEEIEKYIAIPQFRDEQTDKPYWFSEVYENDPLGVFDKIPNSIFDENGVFDKDLVYKLENYDSGVVIGHYKYDGAFIDWIVEGVWNGKIKHSETFRFKDGTICYYENGYYYTPIVTFDRGGMRCFANIESVTPLDDKKYEIKYYVLDDDNIIDVRGTAIMALKETTDGFRFWSIFSIDIEKENTGQIFSY